MTVRLWIKAQGNQQAVLCTQDKTFEMKMVDSSNSVFLIPEPLDKIKNSTTIVGIMGSQIEVF
jgi:hypothetical protein